MQILLIEYDGPTAIRFAAHCNKHDHLVRVTSSLSEARHMLMETDHFDAVFCEMGVASAESLPAIASQCKVPCVAILSVKDDVNFQRLRQAGFKLALCKPLDADVLNTALANISEGKAKPEMPQYRSS
jgi:DNA-binding NarL/FixJ family response regulator